MKRLRILLPPVGTSYSGMSRLIGNPHIRKDTGEEKVGYNSLRSAYKAAEEMRKKHNKSFVVYKCVICKKYHIANY